MTTSKSLPFEGAISAFHDRDAPAEVRRAIADSDPDRVLTPSFPYAERLGKKPYERDLRALQIELVKMQHWVARTGRRVAILFEGRDAAGKGGTIKRFRENLNPRARPRRRPAQAVRNRGRRNGISSATSNELPAAGEIVFFDRSWYNRAVVEHVFGFCTEAQRAAFLRPGPRFREDAGRRGHPPREALAQRRPGRAAPPLPQRGNATR